MSAQIAKDHKVRFDAFSDAFESLAATYRQALDEADGLRRRALRAEDAGALGSAERLWQRLVGAEAEIDEAHAALTVHIKATALGNSRTRRRPTSTASIFAA